MKTILCMTLVGVLGATGPGRPNDRPRGPQPPDVAQLIEKVKQAVDPTAEQTAQFETILSEYEATLAESRQPRESNRARFSELKAEMREARDSEDEARIQEIRDQMRTLRRGGPRVLIRETMRKVAAVLAPEQLPAFQEVMKEQRAARGRQAGAPGRGRRGPGNGFQRFADRLAKEITLSDEQQTQLEKIVAEHAASARNAQAAHRAARTEHREELQELHAELRDANADGDVEGAKLIQEKIRTLVGAPPQACANV